MVKMLEKSGNSPGITLETVEELREAAHTPEDEAYIKDIEEETVAAKALLDQSHEATLEEIGRDEAEGRPDDWQSNPEH